MGTEIALGKSYEELEIGEEASFSKTIGECDIYQFAGISGDFNPVHLNEEYARKTRFERRVAHGVLSMSLAGSVLGMVLPGVGTVLVEISTQFKRPVFIGIPSQLRPEWPKSWKKRRGCECRSTGAISTKNWL